MSFHLPETMVYRLDTRMFSSPQAPDFLYWVDDVMGRGAKNILVDLQAVLFMDSSGLGALVIALKRVRKAGGRFGLCGVSGQAHMLFDVAGVTELFEIYDNVDAFNQALNGA